MVNRELRTKAASLIRKYLSSEITNDVFVDEFPRDKTDAALRAIELRLWMYYDDVREEHCDFAIGSPVEALWQRCALFLDSSLEYEWGALGHHNDLHPIISVISGDIFRARAIEKRKEQGDYATWPFMRRTDFESAKSMLGRVEILADDDFPEMELGAADRLMFVMSRVIAVVQALAFFAAVLFLIYSAFGHKQHWANAILCFVFYLMLLAVGHLMPTAQRS